MKRNSSDYSLIVGVDKPAGMSSHDVVNRVRRIFGERRVGHAGTLDPLAEGVLLVLIGPATRLSDKLIGHDKSYRAKVEFGCSTTTDDSEGEIIRRADVPDEVSDPLFAQNVLSSMIGVQNQIPPVYSAIKVNGKKAYEQSRKGNIIKLAPRKIEVYSADLVSMEGMDGQGAPTWTIDFSVSKGTYIRALARDIGNSIGSASHLSYLQRSALGNVALDDCVSIDVLEELKDKVALDPIRLLGYRFIYAEGDIAKVIENGGRVKLSDVNVFQFNSPFPEVCACNSGISPLCGELEDKESVSVISEGKLKAVYHYEKALGELRSDCIFQKGVQRDSNY